MIKPTTVDQYLLDGCGRCSLGGTPDCKVHQWSNELLLLRDLVLQSPLKEEIKWGMPCYTIEGKNVLMISAFKEFTSISFFKGILLKDKAKVLQKAGENSNIARLFKFKSIDEIANLAEVIQDYIQEAIEIEKSGAKVPKESPKMEFPDELIEKFNRDSEYQKAFENLTPGRQRSYLLHFNQAKQSATKVSRIEKSAEQVFLGKGFNEY